MATFFSFLTQHKLPPRNILSKLMSRPLTWYGVILYALILSVCFVLYLLILRINSTFLVLIPARGGSITEGVIGAPRLINPLTATTQTDTDLSRLIYSGLIKKEPDGSYSPDLADAYTVSPDGLTYTFTLPTNLKWNDGKPLDSHDVAFTTQKYAELHPDSVWSSIAVSTPDPQTVVFTLTQPRNDFLDYTRMGIIPEHIWSAIPDETFEGAKQNLRPVASGPYKVRSIVYQNGLPTMMTLKRNKRYAHAVPYLSHYTIAFFANQHDLLGALTAHTVDMTLAADPSTAVALQDDSFHTEKIASSTIVGLFRLQNNTALSDTVLVTIDQMIDKNAILATVENGYGILPEGASTAPLSPADTSPITIGSGTSLNFSIAVENDPSLLLAAHTLADQLEAHGIGISIKAFDPGTFQDVLRANEYPLFLGSVRNSDIPSGYEPALILYTKAYPFIYSDTLHIALPEYLDAPADRYAHVERWYTRTDKVWKIFLASQT